MWGNKDHKFRVDETVPRSVATGTWRTHCVLALGNWANLATDWCTGLTRQRLEQPSHSTSDLVYKPITVGHFSFWKVAEKLELVQFLGKFLENLGEKLVQFWEVS